MYLLCLCMHWICKFMTPNLNYFSSLPMCCVSTHATSFLHPFRFLRCCALPPAALLPLCCFMLSSIKLTPSFFLSLPITCSTTYCIFPSSTYLITHCYPVSLFLAPFFFLSLSLRVPVCVYALPILLLYYSLYAE